MNPVDKVIEDNPYVTYDEIEAETSLNRETFLKIINKSLKSKKKCQMIRNIVRCYQNIFASDGTWIYHRKFGIKQYNSSLDTEGKPKRDNFEHKIQTNS